MMAAFTHSAPLAQASTIAGKSSSHFFSSCLSIVELTAVTLLLCNAACVCMNMTNNFDYKYALEWVSIALMIN